jgi:hypothetical protein
MCLAKITKRHITQIRPKTGYKFFNDNKDGTYEAVVRSGTFNINQWYLAENIEDSISDSKSRKYKAGFHLFKTKNGAKNSRMGVIKKRVLCEVKYMNTVVEGIDRGQPCVVAQMMKIVGVAK